MDSPPPAPPAPVLELELDIADELTGPAELVAALELFVLTSASLPHACANDAKATIEQS